MAWTPFILHLALAVTPGAVIGAERQWRQRMAGLRTHALVASDAAIFILSSLLAVLRRRSCTVSGGLCVRGQSDGFPRRTARNREYCLPHQSGKKRQCGALADSTSGSGLTTR